MDDREHRLELAREADDQQHRLYDAIELLCFDLTSFFVQELGLGGFYTPDLHQVVRDLVDPFADVVSFGDWFSYLWSVESEDFAKLVSARCGEEVSRKTLNWVDQLPSQRLQSKYWGWDSKMLDLVREWDNNKLDKDTPLGNPEEAHLRIFVRDNIRHRQDVVEEISLVSIALDSDWDALIGRAHEDEEFVETKVMSLSGSYLSQVFWEKWLKQLTNDQANDLLRWSDLPSFPPILDAK